MRLTFASRELREGGVWRGSWFRFIGVKEVVAQHFDSLHIRLAERLPMIVPTYNGDAMVINLRGLRVSTQFLC